MVILWCGCARFSLTAPSRCKVSRSAVPAQPARATDSCGLPQGSILSTLLMFALCPLHCRGSKPCSFILEVAACSPVGPIAFTDDILGYTYSYSKATELISLAEKTVETATTLCACMSSKLFPLNPGRLRMM